MQSFMVLGSIPILACTRKYIHAYIHTYISNANMNPLSISLKTRLSKMEMSLRTPVVTINRNGEYIFVMGALEVAQSIVFFANYSSCFRRN